MMKAAFKIAAALCAAAIMLFAASCQRELAVGNNGGSLNQTEQTDDTDSATTENPAGDDEPATDDADEVEDDSTTGDPAEDDDPSTENPAEEEEPPSTGDADEDEDSSAENPAEDEDDQSPPAGDSAEGGDAEQQFAGAEYNFADCAQSSLPDKTQLAEGVIAVGCSGCQSGSLTVSDYANDEYPRCAVLKGACSIVITAEAACTVTIVAANLSPLFGSVLAVEGDDYGETFELPVKDNSYGERNGYLTLSFDVPAGEYSIYASSGTAALMCITISPSGG